VGDIAILIPAGALCLGFGLLPGATQADDALAAVPKSPGRYLIQASDRRFYIEVPRSVGARRPLPLAIVSNWRVTLGKRFIDNEMKGWPGFDGFAATVIDKHNFDIRVVREIIGLVEAAAPVDKEAVMVVGWRSRIAHLAAQHPDVIQYAYDDSPFGGGARWTGAPSHSGELAEKAKSLRIWMGLTGKDYKPSDRGFDDEGAKTVADYWKAVGAKDVELFRYPASRARGDEDPSCIGFDVSARARKWFESKLAQRRKK
jgi:hypothetical protein